MQPETPDLALFLDFDGTLVEIVERPDAVRVEPGLPGLLDAVRNRLGGAFALVSGRPVAFLDGQFDPYLFDAAGLHGLEHRIAGLLTPCDPAAHPGLRAAVGRLQEAVRGRPGLLVEDKGCSVALHWRMAPEAEVFARDTAAIIAAALGDGYRIQWGKAVAEILPAASGKGRVIERFLEAAPYRGRRPVFVGDDLTDENGFAAVNARGGLSVRIGPGETAAAIRLPSPAALRAVLARWAGGGSLSFDEAR